MAGAFPISTSAFSTMGIRSIQNTIISKSQSGKKLSRQIDGQRFAFTAKIITAKRSDVLGKVLSQSKDLTERELREFNESLSKSIVGGAMLWA